MYSHGHTQLQGKMRNAIFNHTASIALQGSLFNCSSPSFFVYKKEMVTLDKWEVCKD